jgi:hypothetical protein
MEASGISSEYSLTPMQKGQEMVGDTGPRPGVASSNPCPAKAGCDFDRPPVTLCVALRAGVKADEKAGGRYRIRTCDFYRVKVAL